MKTTTEFNLSSKARFSMTESSRIVYDGINDYTFDIGDVKEFIKILKDEIDDFDNYFYNSLIKDKINELAGDKLI